MSDAPLLRLEPEAVSGTTWLSAATFARDWWSKLLLPLWPLAYACLRGLDLRETWSTTRVRLSGLLFDERGVELNVRMPYVSALRWIRIPPERIESLYVRIGEEGDRHIRFRLSLAYTHERIGAVRAHADFFVVEVDTRREATALVMKIAQSLGCAFYRVRREDAAVLELELFVRRDERERGYRSAARPVGMVDVPEGDLPVDFSPRMHRGFAEPARDLPKEVDEKKLGVAPWVPGTRVRVGARPRPLRLLQVPLVLLVTLIAWLLVLSAVMCVVSVVAVTATALFDSVAEDIWQLLANEWVHMGVGGLTALGCLAVAAPLVVDIVRQAIGRRVEIDWEFDRLEVSDLGSKRSMPLGHIGAVAVRRVFGGNQRVYLQTHDGDVPVLAGDEAVEPAAVALARALDVPVTFPD